MKIPITLLLVLTANIVFADDRLKFCESHQYNAFTTALNSVRSECMAIMEQFNTDAIGHNKCQYFLKAMKDPRYHEFGDWLRSFDLNISVPSRDALQKKLDGIDQCRDEIVFFSEGVLPAHETLGVYLEFLMLRIK